MIYTRREYDKLIEDINLIDTTEEEVIKSALVSIWSIISASDLKQLRTHFKNIMFSIFWLENGDYAEYQSLYKETLKFIDIMEKWDLSDMVTTLVGALSWSFLSYRQRNNVDEKSPYTAEELYKEGTGAILCLTACYFPEDFQPEQNRFVWGARV